MFSRAGQTGRPPSRCGRRPPPRRRRPCPWSSSLSPAAEAGRGSARARAAGVLASGGALAHHVVENRAEPAAPRARAAGQAGAGGGPGAEEPRDEAMVAAEAVDVVAARGDQHHGVDPAGGAERAEAAQEVGEAGPGRALAAARRVQPAAVGGAVHETVEAHTSRRWGPRPPGPAPRSSAPAARRPPGRRARPPASPGRPRGPRPSRPG